MAISVGNELCLSNFPLFLKSFLAVLVGEAQNWIEELKERSAALHVNGGFEKGADL